MDLKLNEVNLKLAQHTFFCKFFVTTNLIEPSCEVRLLAFADRWKENTEVLVAFDFLTVTWICSECLRSVSWSQAESLQ